MYITATVNGGKAVVVEEWHVCAVYCKMINLNREPHNRVYFPLQKGTLFSHVRCDQLTPIEIKKP